MVVPDCFECVLSRQGLLQVGMTSPAWQAGAARGVVKVLCCSAAPLCNTAAPAGATLQGRLGLLQ